MKIKPTYSNIPDWEFYALATETEYRQSMDEGLDVETYKELFDAISKLPKNEIKKKLGDVLFENIRSADTRKGYKYIEPSDLDEIKKLAKDYPLYGKANPDTLEKKIYGVWMGRICGCMLGKTIEYMRTDELLQN